MSTNLYVGNVSFQLTEDELKEAFSQAGNVTSAKIIMDKMTGRSRGFAFVEMETEEQAAKAIELMHGTELKGRSLTVNEARPLEDRPPRRDFNRG